MSLNTERLVKLIKLSESDNDNEALVAVRLAHKMIREAGSSWEKVISLTRVGESIQFTREDFYNPFYSPPPKPPKPPQPPPRPQKAKPNYQQEIREMFNDIYNAGQENDFIDSLHTFFVARNYLSPKQFAALNKKHKSGV